MVVQRVIDLRSDTVTKPTQAMRQAMARAEVGDDVYGEDPSVRRLEDTVAAMLGKEAALFVSSGTMGNQLAIRCQCEPGSEMIVSEGAHCAWYESGAAAALSGVQAVVVGRGGVFTADEMEQAIKPRADWYPHTALVAIENTHNRAGGVAWPQPQLEQVCERARQHGLKLHLDGARLWNASVALGVEPARIAEPFDTVSVCFSKGLGAPVGSALCGRRELITKARRMRKMLGGGMRQAGIIAAGALYALQHHRDRLAQDHQNARAIAKRLAQITSVPVHVNDVHTNIVMVDTPQLAAEQVAREAAARGVLVSVFGPRRVRLVTHLDVADTALQGGELLAQAIEALGAGR